MMYSDGYNALADPAWGIWGKCPPPLHNSGTIKVATDHEFGEIKLYIFLNK